MRILITGINGFVGSYLSPYLEKMGYEVFGIDLKSKNENTYIADLGMYEGIEKVIRMVSPDCIIHLAGIARVDLANPGEIYKNNLDSTINLLNASRRIDKKIKFVFISSSLVYGNTGMDNRSIDESFPIMPVNHYGASKAACELVVRAFGEEYDNLDYVIVRPFNHTGKGQTEFFIVPKIVSAFKQKKSEICLGNTETVRDFLDVRDVVVAYEKIIKNGSNKSVYNLASGEGIRISDIVAKLEAITGHSIEIKNNQEFIRKNEILFSLGNSSKLQRDFDWHPRFSFDETLKDMLS